MEQSITVNGKPIDISKAMPIKVGDLRKLQQHGVDLTAIQRQATSGEIPDMESTSKLVLHFCSKCNPDVTEDDVDELTVDELGEVVSALFSSEEPEPSRPT